MAVTYVKAPLGASGSGLGAPIDTTPVGTSFQGSPKLSTKVTTDGTTYLLGLPTAKYTVEGIVLSLTTNSTAFVFKGEASNTTSLNHMLNSAGTASFDPGHYTIDVGGHRYKNAVHTGGSISTEDVGDGFKALKIGYTYTVLGE